MTLDGSAHYKTHSLVLTFGHAAASGLGNRHSFVENFTADRNCGRRQVSFVGIESRISKARYLPNFLRAKEVTMDVLQRKVESMPVTCKRRLQMRSASSPPESGPFPMLNFPNTYSQPRHLPLPSTAYGNFSSAAGLTDLCYSQSCYTFVFTVSTTCTSATMAARPTDRHYLRQRHT
jgi:hypothetical protein